MFKKYAIISTIIILLIFVSFFFISYTIFHGYLIASAIFILALINFFIVHKIKEDFPAIILRIYKSRIKLENFKLALLGGLSIAIGVLFFYFDSRSPFVYIITCYGIYFISFARMKVL